MALQGSNEKEKLASLCSRTYKEQAIWFLNANWGTHEDQAETLWSYVQECETIDKSPLGDANGAAMDEMSAHRFLEILGETLTVMALRSTLRKTGAIDQNERPKLVPLTHYLLFKYESDWKNLVNTCGDNAAEVAEAQAMLDAVSAAFEEADRTQKIAADCLAEAVRLEAPFRAAHEELEAAIAALKEQEDAYNNKTNDLTAKSEGGGVSGMRAKNELAQHLGEDPLPLRRAKLTTEAARKKAERARAPFKAATDAADAAKAAAEAAVEDARVKVAEAEAYLEEVRAKPGSPQGAIWWMSRELTEKKKYLPTSKQ